MRRETNMARDLVCGMQVDEIKAAASTTKKK
jgi:hypothetical protein